MVDVAAQAQKVGIERRLGESKDVKQNQDVPAAFGNEVLIIACPALVFDQDIMLDAFDILHTSRGQFLALLRLQACTGQMAHGNWDAIKSILVLFGTRIIVTELNNPLNVCMVGYTDFACGVAHTRGSQDTMQGFLQCLLSHFARGISWMMEHYKATQSLQAGCDFLHLS